MLNPSKDCMITRVMNAVAAGTNDTQDSTALDMSGWDGVVFIALFGTLSATAVTDIRAQEGATSTPATDLAGTKISATPGTHDNKALILDIYRPLKRYIRCRVTRATANAVIDGIIAIQYRGKKAPVTQGATVASTELHVSPIAGTA